jgi:hypothetical protein
MTQTERSTEIEELILPCIDSTAHTLTTLFSHHISRPFCSIHFDIFKFLDNNEHRLVCLAAPRGFGKTTVIGLGFPARLALFRFIPYIVYISSSVSEAAKKVKILAQELMYNPLIKELFGELKGVKWAEETGEIELSDENGPFCFIQAKGAGSQVRGLKWRQHRPGIFIVDDLENKEESKNEKIRADIKDWFFGTLMGAMDNAEFSDSRLIMIGTVVHQDCLLANLLEERETLTTDNLELDDETKFIIETKEKFYALRLEACNDKYESLWPDFLSTSAIRAKAAMAKLRGQLDSFFMEYRNLVVAGENASFLPSMFKHYSEQDSTVQKELTEGETIIIIDPCKKKQGDGAKASIVGVTLNSRVNKIWVRDVVNEKLIGDELFEKACDMADLLHTTIIGVEVTGIEDYIIFPFEQYITLKRKGYYELVHIKATGDKEDRVRGLSPFYRMGVIYHNSMPHVHGPLETQLLGFPRSKFWDVMDALSHMIKMFDLGNRAFSLPTVIQLEKGVDYKEEDEYLTLLLEDKKEVNLEHWRMC